MLLSSEHDRHCRRDIREVYHGKLGGKYYYLTCSHLNILACQSVDMSP